MSSPITAITDPPGVGSNELQTLAKAFTLFNETTTKLERAHRRLESRVAEIDRELERKNQELARANRHLAENIAELDETRRYLDSVIAGIQDGIVTIDGSEKVLTWNRAAEEITGIPGSRAIGSRLRELVGPETTERVVSCLQNATGVLDFETRWSTESGKESYVRVRATQLTSGSEGCIGALAVFQDLTRVRLLEEKVRRRERLSALGELAAGVAHEMRNPLTTVRGYVQLLPRQSGDPEFLKEMTENVLSEIDRLSGLTRDLLDLARPVGECRLTASPAELLTEVIDFYANGGDFPEVRMVADRLDRSLRIRVERDRCKQVLLNLLLNAIEATDRDGTIRYGVERVKEQVHSDRGDEALARIWIRDSGPGIGEEHKTRIFDPFFTTKDRGTGLGLTLSHAIVEEHGGVIRAENSSTGGAEFSVYLPLVEGDH